MANGGQHYNDFVDCLTGALRVCGATMVYSMERFPMKPPTNFDQVFYLTRLTDDTNPLMLRLVALPAWWTRQRKPMYAWRTPGPSAPPTRSSD